MKIAYAAAASGVLGGLAALLLYSAQHHPSAQVSKPGNASNTTQSAKQGTSPSNGTSPGSQSSGSGSSQTSNTSSGQGQSGGNANITSSVSGSVATKKQQAVVTTVENMLQGSTAKKMDASGFVQYVYAKIGLQLPRTVAEQAKLGTKITNRSQLQKGDLVCFDLSNNKNTVTFDGIYIGNQNFAAKTTHGLEVISLTDNYWSPKFLYGRRIL